MPIKEEQRERLVYCVKGEDVQREAAIIDALSAAEDFRETENPAYGMHAFVEARHLGIKLPENVLTWLTECFEKCLLADGEESMDRIMGLTGGKGGTPPFKEAALAKRDNKLCSRVLELTCHGVQIAEAAGMVCALYRKNRDFDGPATGYEVISEETLAKKYSQWKRREVCERLYKQNAMPQFTTETVAALFRQYPEYAIPERFLPLIRKSTSHS